MPRVELADLLAAGAHFGHLTRRWNPKMKPYIFMERNGIHIIDLKKTQTLVDEACNAMATVVAEGKKILFVGTKKQAKDVIKEEAVRCGQYYISERWLGGALTNFTTIRKSVKRLTNIEKMETGKRQTEQSPLWSCRNDSPPGCLIRRRREERDNRCEGSKAAWRSGVCNCGHKLRSRSH